jgi:long-chain acyl-CoA synthetase
MQPPKKVPKFLKTEYQPPPEPRPAPPPKKVYETIPKLIRHNYDQGADDIAMCQKKFGIWKKYPWRKYYEVVGQLSLGLISLGMKRGDVVCLYGENAPEWFWGEFAVQTAGGIPAGIPVDAAPAEVKYIAANSGAKFAIVSGRHQVAALLASKADLPALQKIICWDIKGPQTANPLLIGFNDALKLGDEYRKANPKLFEQNIDSVTADDIAFTYYGSGTKGPPRGIKLSHKALLTVNQGFLLRFPIQPEDNLISNLPAGSVSDSFFAVIPHLLTGAALNFPEKPETIALDTRETGPNFVFYPHEQWESLAAEIQAKIKTAPPLQRFCYNLLLPTGYKMADDRLQNKKPNVVRRLMNLPANLLFSRPLRDKQGLRKVKFAATDGPSLSRDAFRLIHAIGVELRQTCFMAETGVIACQGENEIDFETVGRPILGTEVRIAEKDELLVRSSALFSGYDHGPAENAEVLVDGWFRTGGTARITEKGQLVVLNRN